MKRSKTLPEEQSQPQRRHYQNTGLVAGPLAFVALLLTAPPAGLDGVAWMTAAVALWMAIWWATEAIAVPATALLPLIAFDPLGIMSMKDAAAPYANPTIYLFLGGFVLAAGIQKSGLHRRIALFILTFVSASARSVVLGFMLVSALLSMWMTNTSTTMMLLPIAVSVLTTMQQHDRSEQQNFQLSLLLGVAYAATIGGVATLVGTPPNAFLAGYMAESHNVQIGFARWMLLGLPVAVCLLPLTWWLLTRYVYPVSFATPQHVRENLRVQYAELGTLAPEEIRVALIFLATALAWMLRPVLSNWLGIEGISDAGIAMISALLMFIVPGRKVSGARLLDVCDLQQIPWGILLLFGGGLSLAAAVSDTGLAQWLGESLAGLQGFGLVIVILAATTLVIFLTELTSNLATTATFLPVMAVVALEMGGSPLALAVPVTLAASCAFMLPVATPPNAIVFSSGYISIPQMVRTGLWLNLTSVALVTFLAVFLAPRIFT
ncbi:SLC13 family permease [Alteromonas halophila]|uniref:Di- and tricarboxylate transporter n=1 Tax=Alteromonas halophila TaxID=516698 RepID=A0A918JQE9_9ALTE|nr:DASS family sodium-coupled anion symporter [Alteromonas halophila]GGW93481.1 di- and tricarboxylate transporter [Alteromonas halophila]